MIEPQEYLLRIDGPLLRKQRKALLDVTGMKLADETYECLDGITELLDEIADQAHDRYGIDCLLEERMSQPPIRYSHDCGEEFLILGQHPDTGTSVDIYDAECVKCGVRGTLSIENQDNSYTFSPCE